MLWADNTLPKKNYYVFETYRSVSSLTNLNKINHGNLELINLKLKNYNLHHIVLKKIRYNNL